MLLGIINNNGLSIFTLTDTFKSCSYLGTKETDVEIYDRGVQQPGDK